MNCILLQGLTVPLNYLLKKEAIPPVMISKQGAGALGVSLVCFTFGQVTPSTPLFVL